MRIKRLMISGFGKFIQKEYELDHDVTLFFGENESGKSTLKDFIVEMLFGMQMLEREEVGTEQYVKRKPWNSEAYGGSMTFQMGEKEYLLERNFDTTKKRDKMYEVETGREKEIVFGNVDKSAYLSTCCLSQQELRPNSDLENLLLTYMTNISQTESVEFDVKRSIEYIRRQKEELSSEENQYRISKIREELSKIQQKEIELEQLQERETVLKSHNMEGSLTEISQSGREKNATIEWDDKISFYRTVIVGGLIFLSIMSMLIQLYWFSALCLIAVPLISCFYYLTDKFCEVEKNLEEQKKRKLDIEQREWKNAFFLLQKQKEELKQQIYQKEELEQEYKQNREEMGKILYRKKALSLAEEKITQAVREGHDQFASLLNEEVSIILEKITGEKYKEVKIDEKLGILVRENNRFIQGEYLSVGTIEQIYFALRLATAKLLFQEENMPIILDDIFSSFDSSRLERTLDYLFLQKQQVIILSCGNEVRAYFERKKKKIQYIR